MPRAVCLDGRNLALHHGTGVATYARSLATNVHLTGRSPAILLDASRRPPSRYNRWLHAAWPGPAHARPTVPPENFIDAWQAPDVFRRAQVHLDIHRRLLEVETPTPPALMHWTYPIPLAFRGTPNVYTIHDLIPLLHPTLTPIDPIRFTRILRLITARAAHIVTVSESSRQDIIDHLQLPPAKVTNTYQSVDIPASSAPPARQGHLLFCGAIEPRKNIARLLAAHQASHARAPLILAGPDGWHAAQELAAANIEIHPLDALRPGAQGGAYRAPYLPRPALLDLLRGARALLLPSLAEGFGLPILEAMTLGVPVLTTATGATAEIAADAALLIEPRDTQAIAQAINALDQDDELCQRLAAAGAHRAALFSPQACMARLATVYDALEADAA